MVQPFFVGCGCSPLGGYELGLGAWRWVYEEARVDEEELFCPVLGTGFGELEEACFEVGGGFLDDLAGDSESEPLSQASSSTHSEVK